MQRLQDAVKNLDTVKVVIDYKFTTFRIPVKQWLDEGPQGNPAIVPHRLECDDGRHLPISQLPLPYRNTRLSRWLIKFGILTNPWPNTTLAEQRES